MAQDLIHDGRMERAQVIDEIRRSLFFARWALYGLAWSYLNKSEFLQDPPDGGLWGWFWGGFSNFFDEGFGRYGDLGAALVYINVWPAIFIGFGLLWRWEQGRPVDLLGRSREDRDRS